MFILPSGPQKSPTVNKSSATQHVIHTYEWLLSDSQHLKADLRSSEARAGCKWIHLHSDQKKYISVSSGLFPGTLYDPTPTHPILAPSLPTPHFLSHQVMTSGFELGSLRVLFSGVQSPLKWNFSYSRSSTKIPRRMFDLFTLHFHQSFTLSIT